MASSVNFFGPANHCAARTWGAAAAVLVAGALTLPCPAWAAGTPDAPAGLTGAQTPPDPEFNPSRMMAMMIQQLEKNPDLVVLMLESLPITQRDVADVIRTMPASLAAAGFGVVQQRALDALVTQKAMVLNARKEGLEKDPEVIRLGKVAMERVLAEAWLSRRATAAVNDSALRARYDRDIRDRPGPEEVRARLILVPTEDEARLILNKARAGADFGDLAKTYSKDGSAAVGGDLGYLMFDGFPPDIGPAAFALAPGQTTASPLRSAMGYVLLRVEGRKTGATPTFEQVRPDLERALKGEAVKAAVESVIGTVKMAPRPEPKK